MTDSVVLIPADSRSDSQSNSAKHRQRNRHIPSSGMRDTSSEGSLSTIRFKSIIAGALG